MVERVALGRVGDRQAHDAVGGLVDQQLAVGELAVAGVSRASRGQASAALRPRRASLAALLEHDERVALVDRLALLAADLGDRAGVLGLDGHLHLHRLEDRDRVALLDLVADGALDFPYGAGDVGLYLRTCEPPASTSPISLTAGTIASGADDPMSPGDRADAPRIPDIVFVILTAFNEADRIEATLDGARACASRCAGTGWPTTARPTPRRCWLAQRGRARSCAASG